MKKTVSLLIVLLLSFFSLTACGTSDNENTASDKTDLVVFAAASMTESLEQIAELYEKDHPDINILFNFDSSGTLKTQIEEGADCDIFISAAPKQMNQLDASKDKSSGNEDGLDFIISDSRVDLVENKVVLVVSDENSGLATFDTMAEALQGEAIVLAMGNEDVPVGQYTKNILDYYGLNESDLASKGLVTYCSNVKEGTTQVSEASVDAGIIYATDAFSAGLKPADTASEEMCGKVVYPAAVLKGSANPEAARAFLSYLSGDEAADIFKTIGFSTL